MASPASHLIDRLATLIERGREAKVRLLRDRSLQRVDGELLTGIGEIIAAAVGVLDDLASSYEDDEAAAGEVADVRLADIAWLSRGEVMNRLEALRAAVPSSPAWQVISLADAALERSERALMALERAVREHEGLPPSERSEQRLRESLEVRRLYTALRRTFLVAGAPAGDDLLDELWAIGAQLDAIRSLDAFGIIRVDDRRQLESLRSRVSAALAGGGEGERRALWQDLSSFAQLLLSIHDREDLQAHDLALVRRSRRAVEGGGEADVDATLLALAPLLGRDAELDALLVDRAGASEADCASVLRRLELELRERTRGF